MLSSLWMSEVLYLPVVSLPLWELVGNHGAQVLTRLWRDSLDWRVVK